MLSRPWPLLLICLFHIVSPVVNLFVSSVVANVSVASYLFNQWEQGSFLEFILMYGLSPLAAYFIYQCKKWSYYSFLTTLSCIILFNYIMWKDNSYLFDPLHVMLFFSFNSLLFGYFLAPSVRRIYLTDRVRWWETETRYIFEFQGFLSTYNLTQEIQIKNLSFSGALVEVESALELGSLVHLEFSADEYKIIVPAEVKNQRGLSFGLAFRHDEKTYAQMKEFMKDVVAPHFRNRDETSPIFESFFLWFSHLICTGEGFFPQQAVFNMNSRKKLKKKASGTKKTSKKRTKRVR